MISEERDTEDWSYDAKNSALITKINYIHIISLSLYVSFGFHFHRHLGLIYTVS